MLRKNFEGRKNTNKKFALERQEVAKNRTPQEQLSRLDAKFGTGQGAVKERAKLAKRIKDAAETSLNKKKDEDVKEEGKD